MRWLRRSRRRAQAPEPAAVSSAPPEPDARAIITRVMSAPPDQRYRAARQIGLLDGDAPNGGPALERLLVERAVAQRKLAMLEETIAS